MIRTLQEAVADAASAALAWENRLDATRSFMPAGHNGPYFQVETAIRNTAHWLCTFAIAHTLTGDPTFRTVGLRLSAFLKTPGKLRGRHALVHRQIGSDGCNGVIGPAWVIEALARAYTHLGDEESGDLARDELMGLPFDTRVGAWRRVDPRTGVGAIDFTYNHQAWLAAAAADVPDGAGREQVLCFLDRSGAGALRTHGDGLIHHIFYAATPRALALRARFDVLRVRRPNAVEEKERGYHLYALYPLLRLRRHFPEHPLFASEIFARAVRHACSSDLLDALDNNRYAYPYNAPGFELPLVATVAEDHAPRVQEVFRRQCEKTLDTETGLHTVGTPDPATLAARIYELAIAVEQMRGADAPSLTQGIASC